MPRIASISGKPLTGVGLRTPVLGLANAIYNSAPTFTNLTVGTTPAQYGIGPILLPTTGVPATITLPTVDSTITVEFWRRFTATPGGFDLLIELNHNATNFVFLETNGSARGQNQGSSYATSGPSWTAAINTWEHYVVTFNTATRLINRAKNGITTGSNDLSAIGTGFAGPITNLRFTSTTYNARATGLITDIRVNNGDTYGLLSGALGTFVPTTPYTATGNTVAIYRPAYI